MDNFFPSSPSIQRRCGRKCGIDLCFSVVHTLPMETPYRCSICKGFFNRNEVLKYNKNKYGVQYYHCQECNAERCKKYRHTKKGNEIFNRGAKKTQKKHYYKQNARVKMRLALLAGKIIKPNKCEKCEQIKIVEGHHFDYEKPLEVVWVCRKCHSLIHRSLVE